MNYPRIVKIIETKAETKDVQTITFRFPEKTTPGQFFMIWIPDVDEIPMSVSHISRERKGVTFRNVGEATGALSHLKPGDRIGVRGPYGNGFKLLGKKILFVGGGTGVAMLAPAVEEARRKHIVSTVILGFKNKGEIFFEERLIKTGAEVRISTDDGSKGYKGFASGYAEELLTTEKFTSVLTCGPEMMMKRLLDICKSIPFQASLERYIKCGIGICGQCCIGEGLRVCEEGPVFDGRTLKKMEDFGVYKRDAAGRKIRF